MNVAPRKGARPSSGSGHKKGQLSSVEKNGSGPPLTYNEPSDDENMNEIIEESLVSLNLILPGGATKELTVDANIPMMDLLVNLAANCRLNPAGYSLVVLSQVTGKPRDYKANQTIGSLCGAEEGFVATVQLVSKKGDSDKKSTKNARPFETTYRFTVNLPRSHKKVLRISPNLTLQQLHQMICEDRKFNPSQFMLQHPANPMAQLDLTAKVGEIGLNEINVIAIGMVDSAKSMPDLSRSQSLRSDPAPSYMPGQGEKKKRGFLSFLGRKERKMKLHDISMDIEPGPAVTKSSPRGQTTPPTRRTEKEALPARPKTMFVTSSSDFEQSRTVNAGATKPVKENVPPANVLSRPGGKKRHAPPPPQQRVPPTKTIQVEVNIDSEQRPKTEPVRTEKATSENRTSKEHLSQKLHSRNSSDSSGYHELTLSGAESPDAARIDEDFEMFKTSLDTTSIDSGEHLNGDSGIRDISPPRRRPPPPQTMPGEYNTLPLDKNTAKIPPKRAQSLERADEKKKPVSYGKKKKAPPPPPGGPHVPTSSSKSTLPGVARPPTHPTPPSSTISKTESTNREETEVPITISTESTSMLMVPDDSIKSEDIDIDRPRSQRPCAFIPPPPPKEPPPPDSEPVDYNMVIGQIMDRVDIGVGEDSTGPDSTKSSPASAHSRVSRRSSLSSVNTLEDLSMAFNLTIAAAEEALEQDSLGEADIQLTSKDTIEIEKLPLENIEAIDDVLEFHDEDLSPRKPETESETNSLSKFDETEKTESSFGLLTDSVESYLDLNQEQGESLPSPDEDHPAMDEDHRSSPCEMDTKLVSADKEVSEITYKFTVDSVPPGFETDLHRESVHSDSSEEEEHFTETIEEISTFPGIAAYRDLGSPRRIPDLETPKEHQFPMHYPGDLSPRESFVLEVGRDEPEEFLVEAEKSYTNEVPVEEEPKEKEKEEIILTFDDLNNIDFSGPKRKHKERTPSSEIDNEEPTESFIYVAKPAIAVNMESPGDAHVTPYKEYPAGSVRGIKGTVKNRCSELDFSPHGERETENFLEEKSISMIALPAQRSPAEKYVSHENNVGASSDEEEEERKYSPRRLEMSDQVTDDLGTSPLMENGEASSSDEQEMSDQQEVFQNQYKQLEEQFSVWQEQLNNNQKLLASESGQPKEQSLQLQQLQLQMQMQQQMMLQLQQSMQVLTVQQTKGVEFVPAEPAHPEPDVPVSPPPPPPPPPPTTTMSSIPPEKKKTVEKKPKERSKQFEPQLDPREELMIAVRNFGGRSALKKVPVKETRWHFAT